MPDHNILLSLHLPKTGGTTFKYLMREIYKDQMIEIKGGFVNHVDDSIKREVEKKQSEHASCVIYGHYYLDKFHAVYPQAKLAVWLRDPVQRLLSQYFYKERTGDGVGYTEEELHNEGNIYKFVSQPDRQNIMSNMIGNHKIEDFDFVGLTEEFDKSMDLFSKIFSTKKAYTHKSKIILGIVKFFKMNEIHVKYKNRNPNRKSGEYEISENLRQAILDINKEDTALYAAGKEQFEKLCRTWL